MKLLFDENLSCVLPAALADLFPGSRHVRDEQLRGVADALIWAHAKSGDFAIVTKDDDFSELSVLLGAPPKLVMLRLGNCRTQEVADLLRARQADMSRFASDPTVSLMYLP